MVKQLETLKSNQAFGWTLPRNLDHFAQLCLSIQFYLLWSHVYFCLGNLISCSMVTCWVWHPQERCPSTTVLAHLCAKETDRSGLDPKRWKCERMKPWTLSTADQEIYCLPFLFRYTFVFYERSLPTNSRMPWTSSGSAHWASSWLPTCWGLSCRCRCRNGIEMTTLFKWVLLPAFWSNTKLRTIPKSQKSAPTPPKVSVFGCFGDFYRLLIFVPEQSVQLSQSGRSGRCRLMARKASMRGVCSETGSTRWEWL